MVLDRICGDASAALRPGGLLLLVQSELSRPEETVGRLSAAGLDVRVTDRVTIPFGRSPAAGPPGCATGACCGTGWSGRNWW